MTEKKVAFITGGSSGIGEALALEYSRHGFAVVLCARREAELKALAAKIEALGGEALALRTDVAVKADVESAVTATVARFGRIDVAVANAGLGVYGVTERVSVEDFKRQFDVNVFGVIHTIQAALPEVKKQNGAVAIVGSAYSYFTTPFVAPYTMSKYAVKAFGETLDQELYGSGVTVTMIYPGLIGTQFRKVDKKGVVHVNKKESLPTAFIVTAEQAAREIYLGISTRKREVVIGRHAKFLIWMQRHFPGFFRWVVVKNRAMAEKSMRPYLT